MTVQVEKLHKVVHGDHASPKKPARAPLFKQSQKTLTLCLLSALTLAAFFQEAIMRDAETRMTCKTVLYILVVSYCYCDYWLWMLHCFLDRKENLESRIPDIKEFATKFQEHHDFPTKVLYENHLGEIDDLVSAVAGMGLLLGYWTSPATKLIVVGVCMWGSLGSLNHFYGHALTNGYEIPPLYKYGQRWGLLPTAKHHKTHHTAPFEMNWNFLNGFYRIYEAVYFSTGSSYNGLFAMFYTCNPAVIQTWALALGILA
eukprot:TRINITY_DN1789_c0_g1_i1.p1 TRINITY_DN1789_c0_g1~~TRINITY_DN1789_c0_g1_i1.p1  ORF type:complete len:258 (-),score=34.43 TRINITY_DN1789_c0_g1_i1:353-1126(-)